MTPDKVKQLDAPTQGAIKLFRSGHYFDYLDRSGNLANLTPGNENNSQEKGRKYPFGTKQKAIFVSRAINLAEYCHYKPKTFLLTYNSDHVPDTKKHINTFLTRARRGDFFGYQKPTKEKPISWVYALELTDVGQFHYHFLMDAPYIDPDKIKAVWNSTRGYVSNNSVRDLRTLKNEVASAVYCSKYFSKAKRGGHYEKKNEGLRFWASSNNLVGGEYITVNDMELKEKIRSNSIFNVKKDFFTKGFVKSNVAGDIFKEEMEAGHYLELEKELIY